MNRTDIDAGWNSLCIQPSTCGFCGDEFETWVDSYCGRQFIETEFCRKCSEDEGKSDPMGGWDEDQGRDR